MRTVTRQPGVGSEAQTAREIIGLVGLGLLGSGIGERLLAHGFGVKGFDLDASRLQAFGELGGQVAANAGEVIAGCRRVVLSLPDSAAVEAVIEAAAPHFRHGQVLIDTTTGAPAAAEAAGRSLAARGVAYLDAAICGNSAELRRGEVLVVAGGPAQAFEACQDLFATFARRSWHLGDWGAGSKMKLITNLVLGLNRAVLAEGLAFAEALGLDSELALTVLRESSSYSRVMDLKGRKMLERDFAPQARLSQHLKDVRLMLEAAAKAGAKLPLSEFHRQLLEQAEAAGLGALDNSAIIEVFRRRT
jgi:3-hydroxyisobutyrate dehydrogenase-like beta-hydroxyacid dehydrogenase